MESSTILQLSQLSFFPPKPCGQTSPFRPWKQRTSQRTRLNCQKMYVPGSGASPEAKAANNLHHFFTYIAVRIVTAQLQVRLVQILSSFFGPAFLALNAYLTEQSYNREAYEELMEFLSRHSLNDGDKFCADLMRASSRHQSLALRILEVRSAYCKNDFEWHNLKRLAFKMVGESNTRLMRDYVLETVQVKSESEK